MKKGRKRRKYSRKDSQINRFVLLFTVFGFVGALIFFFWGTIRTYSQNHQLTRNYFLNTIPLDPNADGAVSFATRSNTCYIAYSEKNGMKYGLNFYRLANCSNLNPRNFQYDSSKKVVIDDSVGDIFPPSVTIKVDKYGNTYIFYTTYSGVTASYSMELAVNKSYTNLWKHYYLFEYGIRGAGGDLLIDDTNNKYVVAYMDITPIAPEANLLVAVSDGDFTKWNISKVDGDELTQGMGSSITIDKNNRYLISYLSQQKGLQFKLKFARSADQGRTWETRKIADLTQANYEVGNTAITVDSKNNYSVAFSELDTGTQQYWTKLASSQDGGENWQVADIDLGDKYISLLTNNGGKLVATNQEVDESGLKINMFTSYMLNRRENLDGPRQVWQPQILYSSDNDQTIYSFDMINDKPVVFVVDDGLKLLLAR